ncbi:MAG: toll/interleukin-1 receptor domain-containing protein [Sphingomonadales bacterium]|nr:toll/interleukin-1 receptor domain-containing protein [Sphingomonadales bacterium]
MANKLPSKLPQYLVRLHGAFEQKGQTHLSRAIAASHFYVREGEASDNWNGGRNGHGVVLFVPLSEMSRIDVDDQDDVADQIRERLNKMANAIDDEWFNSVSFELFDKSDDECRRARPFSPHPPVNPDAVEFWKPGHARVFISHRDLRKKEARELSDALEDYGISCFVAHDTIQPMSEWRAEIMKGLQTMEVMLVFLTDDFTESMWCHQEVGFALGKGIPIISLKLGKIDPPGFISHVQALRGQIDEPLKAAKNLFLLIGKALHRQERLQEVLVTSFTASRNFSEAIDRFDRMKDRIEKLPPQQVERIIEAYRDNNQLHGSIYLANKAQRLLNFLEKTTGKKFERNGNVISEVMPLLDDDQIPF